MSEISVIIPVYNVEKYLKRCIESVLSQTFKEIEILLIDDGSTDRSGKICDDFSEKDTRIRVIHKNNGGLSSARNCGIENATSPLLGFVDSDDYIDPDMYEVLYNELKKADADIAMCDLVNCYEGQKIEKHNREIVEVLNSEQAIKMVMEAKKTSVTAVNKLYKRYIFEEIRYPEGKLSEDAFVIIDILMRANKVVFTSKQKYYYIHRKGSITTSAFKEKDLNVIEAYEKNQKLIEEFYPKIKDVAQMRYLWAHFYVLDKMVLSENVYDKKIEKKIVHVLRKNVWFILNDPRFNKSRKAAMLLLMIHMKLYKMCVLIKRKKYIE